MDFTRAARILLARKWLILLSVILTGAATFGATRLMGANWQSTVRLLTPQGSPLTDSQSPGLGDPGAPAFGPYAREAAASMAAQLEAISESRDVLEPALTEASELDPLPDLVERITVEADSPRLFSLMVTHPNAQRSEALANALADALVDRYAKLTSDQAGRVNKVLRDQLKKAEEDLAAARQDFDRYRETRGFVGNPTVPNSTNSLELVLARLRDATMRHDEAVRRIADAEAQIRAKESQLARLPALTAPPNSGPSPAVISLEAALAQADVTLTALRSRYNERHPEVRAAQSSRDAVFETLQQAKRNQAAQARNPDPSALLPNPSAQLLREELARLRQQLAGYQAEARTLEGMLASARSETENLRGVDSTLSQLAGDVVAKTEARAGLMQRVAAANMAIDVSERQSPLAVVSRVGRFNPPVNTTSGRSLKLVALAALCALLASSGIVIALDSYDNRLRNVAQANMALPTRVLAVIPQPATPQSYSGLARAAEFMPQSLPSESYRFLGLHLLSPTGPRARSLMVLSAKADQGSTTALTNLAITLAQAGKRVVAVDANVRTAELHQVFGLPNEVGFTDVLQDPARLEEAIHQTSVPGLEVITSGPVPDNPWALFRSDNLGEVSRDLHRRADFVLYDTPSALLFTDALNLAPVVDAAFLVVRAQESLTGAEQRLVDLLEQHEVRVLGSVLNDVPLSVMEGYHNYQHYYGAAAAAREGGQLEAPRPMLASGSDAGPEKSQPGPVIDL